MTERSTRGRPPTCLCGTCNKCKYRTQRREYMRDYNAGIRRPRSHSRTWTPENDALLGTMSDTAVARELGCSLKAVQHRRYKLGIPRYWQPKHRNGRGYVVVTLAADDPLIEMTRTGRQVQEHRLVMARHLGRPLTQDEIVHHRNGIRDDNRIENLELWTRAHPDGQRVEDVFAWAVEFIERYAEDIEMNAEERNTVFTGEWCPPRGTTKPPLGGCGDICRVGGRAGGWPVREQGVVAARLPVGILARGVGRCRLAVCRGWRL